jgi:peroxiredoxin
LASLAKLQTSLESPVHIVAVGMGQPSDARDICTTLAPNIECMVDTDQSAYRAFGLGSGSVGAFLTPSVIAAGVKAYADGYGGGKPVGDVLQMPGTFVIRPSGQVALAYYSRTVADHPSDEVLRVALS